MPEYLAPRRWYPWSIQQAVLVKILHNVPLAQIERECLPCRRTIMRWKKWLHDQFLVHSSSLRARFSDFGLVQSIETFWPTCFEQMGLAKAMLYVHQGGEVVP